MKYFILGITIVALLGLVLLLSGCINSDDSKKDFAKDSQELDKSLSELNELETQSVDDLSGDLDSLDDNTLTNDETTLDSDMSELNSISDDDITTDLTSLEDLNWLRSSLFLFYFSKFKKIP